MKQPVNRRRLHTLCFLLLFACAAAPADGAGEYRTVEVESLKIAVDSEWASRAAPGYVPVRFDITNLGEARVIEIAGEGTRFLRGTRGGSPARLTVRQLVRLARGDRVRVTIPVPVYADSENVRFEIREGGRTVERFNYTGFVSRVPPDGASALIVADRESAFGKVAAGWPRPLGPSFRVPPGGVSSGGGVAGGRAMPPLDFVLDPARLPGNWLGFTSLRAVIIGPAEWEQLNDEQKGALLTWTACGGDLLFVDGDLGALFPGRRDSPASAAARTATAYFFGRIHLPTSASIAAAGLSDTLVRTAAVRDSNWVLPANGARDWAVMGERGFRLPIPGVGGVPARAYLSILMVFSILIGPINYWFLWRKRQQVLLVLTAPLISVVFIVLLGGYVIAGEGLGVRGRAVTFTMLDQVRKQAVTRATMSLYAAGMTPGGGLAFPRDHAVFVLGPDGSGGRDAQTLDLTDTQRFAAGAVQARSPANLEAIGFRPARERLGVTRESGGIGVVNGLGTTIAALIYRDGDTIYSLAASLPAGGRAILKPGAPRGADIVPPGLPLSSRFEHLFDHPPDGSYLAVLERSPFWESGVKRLDERGSFHVLIGWVAGQP